MTCPSCGSDQTEVIEVDEVGGERDEIRNQAALLCRTCGEKETLL